MYGLDDKADLSFLNSKEVLQVCIGSHATILNFADDVSIVIEAKCQFSDRIGPVMDLAASQPAGMANLTVLVGQTVKSWAVLAESDLRLEFSDGAKLTIFDSESGYESFSVTSKERSFVV